MKEKEYGYICFNNKNIGSDEQKAVERYWEFDSANLGKFTYSVSPLARSVGLSNARFVMLVRKHYHYFQKSASTTCELCGHLESVGSRRQYAQFLKNKHFQCQTCIEQNVKLKREAEELKLKAVQRKKSQFSKRHFLGNYKIEQLNYSEKIFLYLFLSDMHITEDSNEYLYFTFNKTISGSKVLDSKITVSLIEKNILCDLSVDYSDEYNITSLSPGRELFNTGFYFVNSEHYRNQWDFLSQLYEDISNKVIHHDELESLANDVRTIRIESLYTLINFIESERGISIDKKLRLDHLLQYVSERYSLRVCSYLFNKIATEVAAYIHKYNVEHYSKKYLFSKFLDHYLIKVESNKWEIIFERYLPQEIGTTNLEAFVCSFYLDNKLNWFDLNTEDIVKIWVGSLDIKEIN